jgi:L-asparaginase II
VSVLLAEVTRGGAVESVHAGTIAVVDTNGRLVASVGDAETFAYFRSSAKPFQAIPVVESGAADAFGFTPAELALCCASHYAEPHHQHEVKAMLAKIGLDEGALRCGIPLPSDEEEAGRIIAGLVPRSPLQCDCSGKHSGMLATCVHLGYPIDSYLDPDHPAQRTIRGIVAGVCRVPLDSLRIGFDGCSVPTFGTSIRAFATAFAVLAQPERVAEEAGGRHADALNRLRSAMIAHPDNVSGTGDLVTTLMSVGGGKIAAKTGAEGLICLALPNHGLGIAIRVADGSFRSHPVIVAAVLEQLGLVGSSVIASVMEKHPSEVRNHNGWHVGDMRAAFQLQSM